MSKVSSDVKAFNSLNQIAKNFASDSIYYYINNIVVSKEDNIIRYMIIDSEVSKILQKDTMYGFQGDLVYQVFNKLAKPTGCSIYIEGDNIYLVPQLISEMNEVQKKLIKDSCYLIQYTKDLEKTGILKNWFRGLVYINENEMTDITKEITEMLDNKEFKKFIKVDDVCVIVTKQLFTAPTSKDKYYLKYEVVDAENDIYSITIKHIKSSESIYYKFRIVNISI
jgi:hypothetical protein